MAFYEPLWSLGHDLSIIIYDLIARENMGFLPTWVEHTRPDVVILIGAHEDYHPWPVPTVDVLAKIGAKYPLVHFCCDGAESVWWTQIQRYYDHGQFSLQINIDGVRTGPIGERGMTLLTPIDSEPFSDPPKPWKDRPTLLGFSGSKGGGDRGAIIDELVRMRLLVFRERDNAGPESYRAFLSDCKCILNHAATGSETSFHIKGRTIEAALAGALVLENEGSPLAEWFEAGKDFLTYKDAADVQRKLSWILAHRDKAEAMAISLRSKVLSQHNPKVFWDHVFGRMGLQKKRRAALFQPAFRPWRREVLQESPTLIHSTSPPRARAVQRPRAPQLSPKSVVKVNGQADNVMYNGDEPKLIESINGANLVWWKGAVYAVPHRLGRVHLAETDLSRHPSIRSYSDLAAARREVG